jgi:hypothetical protein
LVPIPNGRGRHRAAPFGLGPWDGAGVAPQQGPTLRPGQRYYRRPEGAVETGQNREEIEGPRCGPVVRCELPGGGLRSLPFGPTRDVSWMRRPGLARVRVSSTMLWLEWPGRGGIRTRQIRVCRGRGPGGAAHGFRGRYLAKECVGSNRLRKERLQLPAAKRRQPSRSRTPREQPARRNPRARSTRRERNARPALPLRSSPEENRFRLTSSFRNGHIDRGMPDRRRPYSGTTGGDPPSRFRLRAAVQTGKRLPPHEYGIRPRVNLKASISSRLSKGLTPAAEVLSWMPGRVG